jgi:hypothetical protein
VNGLAPKVDTARDKIVDDLIPRLAEAISAWADASAAARDEVVSRGQGAAAVMSGDAVATPKGKKKKRVLLVLGVLTAASAAAMAVMKKSAPKDDPWTTPIADPYVPASNGRHSATRADGGADPAETAPPSPLDPIEDSAAAVSDVADVNKKDATDKAVNGHESNAKDTTTKDATTKDTADKNGSDKKPRA